METLLQIVLVLAGLFLLYLTYRMYKRNWKAPTWICAVLGILAIVAAQPWVQGFLKTNLLTLGFEYGERLNDYQNTVSRIDEIVRKHQDRLDEHQTDIDKQHRQLKTVHDELLLQVTTAEAAISNATASLAKQQKDLSDVQYLVRNLFSRAETETFTHTDSNRMFIVENPPSNINARAVIFFQLKKVPIKQSLRLQFHLFSQPFGSYMIANNIVYFRWGDAPATAREHPFYVDYVADPSPSNNIIVINGIKVSKDEVSITTTNTGDLEQLAFPRELQ